MVYKLQGWASVRSFVDWEDFLVLQVFLQRDAARHGGCELEALASALASAVRFSLMVFLPIHPILATRPVMVAASRTDFTSLLSDMVRVCSIFRVYFICYSADTDSESSPPVGSFSCS